MVSPFFQRAADCRLQPGFRFIWVFQYFSLELRRPGPTDHFPRTARPAHQRDRPIFRSLHPHMKNLICFQHVPSSCVFPAITRPGTDRQQTKSAYAPPKEVKLCSRSVKKRFLFLLYQNFFKKSNRHPPSWGRSVPHKTLPVYILYHIFSNKSNKNLLLPLPDRFDIFKKI